MSDYQQRVTDSFNERKRLIRLRRRKENLRFWQEFGIIPRWLIILVIVLFLAAQAIAFLVNMSAPQRGDQIFPPELRDNPALASLALAGIVTAASLCMAVMIFMIAYVNRDASRRGMSAALWTILVLILRDLFSDARAASVSLSAVRKHRGRAFQLLPQLQMQLASFVPAVQARNRGIRQVLPLLRQRFEISAKRRRDFCARHSLVPCAG